MLTFLELRGSKGPPGNPGSTVPGIASNGAMELMIENIKTLIICDTLINNLFIHKKTYIIFEMRGRGSLYTNDSYLFCEILLWPSL